MRAMTVEEMEMVEGGGGFWKALACIGGIVVAGVVGDIVAGPAGGIAAGVAAHVVCCPEDAH